MICECRHYPFPHRPGGGQCPYDGRTDVCTHCEHAAEVVEVDCGIGRYEYWGAKGFHHDWQELSRCCEAPVTRKPGE